MKNYCFTFEAEFEKNEGQYPLEDLLSQYSLSCTEEYFETKETIQGGQKSIIEVETLTDEKEDLINILNFSTIIGRTIENVIHEGFVLLVIKYGIAKIKLGESEKTVPIFAERNDRSGMINFEVIYPELQLKCIFEESVDTKGLISEQSEIEFVLLKDFKAFVIFKTCEQQKYQLVYGLNGYERTEKIKG